MIKKLWPMLVSASGGALMILAFFIPSLQDQWDRYQARKVIQQYAEVGDDLVLERNFKMAEEAYAKAYELSEGKRLDIEVKRLTAKVNRIYQDPEWGSNTPEGLDEIDFQLLLHLQKGPEHMKKRASILTSYGIFLASEGKAKEAQAAIESAILSNPNEVLAYINLGNLLDQAGKKDEAEKAYQAAISIDANSVNAHYNLGLLFSEQGKFEDAEKEFSKTIKLDPNDSDAVNQLKILKEKSE